MCIKFIKQTSKKYSENNNVRYLALLQIRSSLLARLTQSYNIIIQLLYMEHHTSSQQGTNYHKNDEDHYEALAERQEKTDNYDSLRYYNSIPIRSIVAVQKEDSGPWNQGTNIAKGNHNHNDQSYRVWVTKTGQLKPRKSKYLTTTPITAV